MDSCSASALLPGHPPEVSGSGSISELPPDRPLVVSSSVSALPPSCCLGSLALALSLPCPQTARLRSLAPSLPCPRFPGISPSPSLYPKAPPFGSQDTFPCPSLVHSPVSDFLIYTPYIYIYISVSFPLFLVSSSVFRPCGPICFHCLPGSCLFCLPILASKPFRQ